MASVSQHLTKAEYNQRAADAMAAQGFFDWAISALFYAALNLTQAHLLETGVEVTTHVRRRRAIIDSAELATILEPYSVLQLRSEAARYDCQSFSLSEYVETRDGVYAVIVRHLRDLRGTR